MPNTRQILDSRRVFGAFAMLLCVAGLSPMAARQSREDETTRRLWDTTFINKTKKRAPARRKRVKRIYRNATPAVPVLGVAADTVVGVTIWRLRRSRPAETGERILVHESAGSVEWAPERATADTKFSQGDLVRLSIEAARVGYLYVVDREQYANGSLGDPYLIFPTTRTLGGDNRVRPGRIIEVPAQGDDPPYFKLTRSRPDQVGESLTVLVTPSPLEGLEIGESSQRISPELLATWEKSWGGLVGRLEMENTAGVAWTREEREAGADRTRSLTEDEPKPQTIYFRPGAESLEPFLVKVDLQYKAPATPSRSRLR